MNNKDQWAAIREIQSALKSSAEAIQTLEKVQKDLLEQFTHLEGDLLTLKSLMDSRNRSAAVKRNMTDDDARRVLIGDVASLPHKQAAESIGLTYAQVYSARMQFTFKHIHKELSKTEWVNPWRK